MPSLDEFELHILYVSQLLIVLLTDCRRYLSGQPGSSRAAWTE